MDANRPDGDRGPPLNLTRAAYGYLVIGAGVAVAVLVLLNVPAAVPYPRLVRLLVGLAIAAATGYVYQYVTNTWYEQFE